MAKLTIDIGVQGNDGTGDSIRESFRKVNENFNELYAIFGNGDTINFSNLGDTPTVYGSNSILTSNDAGDAILARALVEGNGITIDKSDPAKITIASTGGQISADLSPSLGNALNGNGFAIGKIAEPSAIAVNQFNAVHGPNGTTITIDDMAISKGYADRRYIQQTGGSSAGQIRLRDEPANASEYTKNIDSFIDGNASIIDHGYDSGVDGIAFTYSTTGTNATNVYETQTAPNIVAGRTYIIETVGTTDFTTFGAITNTIGTKFDAIISGGVGSGTGTVRPVYYFKYVSASQLSFHPTFDDARQGTNRISVSGGTGVHSLTDAFYDASLEGYWLSNEALPRKGIVRRQGDTMTGALTLHDHPGALAGQGTPNGDDDLQAATKYYVDNSSFASIINLYVATTGDDAQTNTPAGKEGRALAYAFRTIHAACEYADALVREARPEPGPYQQKIAYANGLYFSRITQITSSPTGYTRLYFSNNSGDPVDQGVLNNIDIIPGKLLRGVSSDARANIVYYYGADGTSPTGEDYMDVDVVDGTFKVNEELIFGESVKDLNITIHVESGIYEEDLPIRLPANVAIVGDEMRRTIIRPKDRVSKSRWADVPFYRDAVFDELRVVNFSGTSVAPSTTATPSQLTGDITVTLGAGTASSSWIGKYFRASQGSTNPSAEGVITAVGSNSFSVTLHDPFTALTAVTSGDWGIYPTVQYGRHYLQNPAKPVNTLILDIEDKYPNSATLLEVHKDLIKDEVIRYINATYPALTYNQTLCARDVGLIVDALCSDLRSGNIDEVLNAGEQYFVGNTTLGNSLIAITTQLTETLAGIGYINTLAQQIITNTPISPKRGILPQDTTTYDNGETASSSRIADQVQTIQDIINKNDPASVYNPPKNNKDMDVFLCNDSNILRQICVQGHGGFMMVLDPDGQVLSKSPYCQQSSSFSQSLNKQAFRGGQFVDGFAGNLTATVTNKNDSTHIVVTDVDKKPLIPCFFQINANRYRVDAVHTDGSVGTYPYAGSLLRRNKNFIAAQVEAQIAIDNPSLTYKNSKSSRDVRFLIDSMVHDLLYYGNSETLKSSLSYYSGRQLQLPNALKSVCLSAFSYMKTIIKDVLSNATVTTNQDLYTQVKDLVNPGEGGSLTKIDNLVDDTLIQIITNGVTAAPSRVYPKYLLLLSSSTTLGSTVLTSLPQTITLNTAGNTSMLSNDFTQINDLGYGLVCTNKGLIETVSVFTYYTHAAYYAKNGGQIRSLNGSNAHGVYGLVAEGGDPLEVPDNIKLGDDLVQVGKVYKSGIYAGTADVNQTSFILYGFQYNIPTDCDVEINHGSSVGIVSYAVSRCDDVSSTLSLPTGTVIRVNLASGVLSTVSGLSAALTHDQKVTIRARRSFRFYDVTETNPIRPSTALTFIGDPSPTVPAVYRAVEYSNSNSIGTILQYSDPTAIATVARTGSTATVTTSTAHGLIAGKYVTVDCSNTNFNVTSTTVLSTPSTTSFTYTTGGSGTIGSSAATGTVTPIKEAQIKIDQDYRFILMQVKQQNIIQNAGNSINIVSVARSANVATVTTDLAHGLKVGERVSVNCNDDLYDVDQVIVTAVGTLTFSYANAGSGESTKAATGTVSVLVPSKKDAIPITSVTRTSNVTTATTTRAHGLITGDYVRVVLDVVGFNVQDLQITKLTDTTFSYANTGSDAGATVVVGDVYHRTRVATSSLVRNGSNVTTVTTANAHGLQTGDTVAIAGADSAYNTTSAIVTVTATTTFTYSNTGGAGSSGTQGYVIYDKTLGAKRGDKRIAINRITTAEAVRLNTSGMTFGWDGKIHKVLSYYDMGVSENYGYITFENYLDLNSPSITGLQSGLTAKTNSDMSTNSYALQAGILANEEAEVLVNISTCRATGHDFLDIGSGGYNATNFPTKIYGRGGLPNQENETVEKTQGRVFYISSDQNGFFRVGRFFTVDQGTGSVQFNASIGLTGITSLGLASGNVIRDFSDDPEFIDGASDSVPTENATQGYIDRRLGINRDGTPLSSLAITPIGPGFMDRAGILPAAANLSMGGFKLTNVAAPVSNTDAVNKTYVDTSIAGIDRLDKMNDSALFTPDKSDILVFAGESTHSVSATVTGDVTATLTSSNRTTLTTAISGLLQTNVNSGIVVQSAVGFPTSGYIQIDNEIFYYAGLTTGGGVERFDTVTRLSLLTPTSTGKLYGGTAATHAIGATVIGLSNAQLDYQINPDTIINLDVKSNAAIAQSKLALNLATATGSTPSVTTIASTSLVTGKRYRIATSGTTTWTSVGAANNSVGTIFQATGTAAGTGTADELDSIQAVSGVASFDSNNFEITNGWVGIKNGGVRKAEIENVADKRLLGNFSGGAAAPSEITSQTVVEEGLRTAFSTAGAVTVSNVSGTAPNNTNTYAIVSITTSGANDSLVKTGSNGEVDTKQLKVDGYKIIDTAGTHVEFYSPIASGAPFNFLSSNGTDATGTTAIKNNATVAGDLGLTGSLSLGSSSNITVNTNKFTVQGSSGNTVIAGTLSSGTFTTTDITTGGATTAGNLTGAWLLKGASKITLEATGVIDALAGQLKVDDITTGSATTTGTIVGDWTLNGKWQATYADLAEYYSADAEYEPGTVLIFGGTAEVTTTGIGNDSRVAGVVSTDAAYTMNKGLEGTRALVALQGRVPCKVLGYIKKGDLITTAAIPGYACKAMNPQVGTIIGKAIADKLDPGKGIVEVAVGRL